MVAAPYPTPVIKVTIERTTKERYVEKKNLCTKETPTEVKRVKSSYGGGSDEEVQFAREFAVVEIPVDRDVKTTLLEQEITDDAKFDLGAVIKAINGL